MNDKANRGLDQLCVNALRVLSIDMSERAQSGHPGLPLGAAPMAYVLWDRFLRHHPSHPDWFNRDRFIFSAGHGSELLFSLLYLSGYNLNLEDLKKFRQWNSQTPGHQEYDVDCGIEASTGPLGQGFAMAVGIAAAEAHLASRFKSSGLSAYRPFTDVLVCDGHTSDHVVVWWN